MKFGVELEMVVYAKNTDALKWLEEQFEPICDVDDDGSLYEDQKVSKEEYPKSKTYEMKSEAFEDYKGFIKDLRRLLFSKRPKNPYSITINESGGDIRIDFNHSTGTHIHFSSIMNHKMLYYNEWEDEETLGNATQEYKFMTPKIAEKMRDYIYNKLERYPSIQNACYRSYSNKSITERNRESCINISNERGHGTIEFRMFNLRGIKTKDFLRALTYELVLVKRAIRQSYRLGIKEYEKKLKKDLLGLKDYYKKL